MFRMGKMESVFRKEGEGLQIDLAGEKCSGGLIKGICEDVGERIRRLELNFDIMVSCFGEDVERLK